jgi:cytochrome c-type biogenesis protein CcmH
VVQMTIDEALLLNSNEQAIMSILAVEALLSEDLAGAANYWRRQVSQLPVGSEQIAQLNERIATIESYLAEEGQEETIGADNAVELTITVSIDESIRDQIGSDMKVYIFARSEGTPPLAAIELNPADLPATVTLNEGMAMLPQFNLSSVTTAYVGASIARQAVAQPGDFQALSETFVIAEQEDTIVLSIKDRLP